MQNKISVPAIIAGIFTAIVALFNLINVFNFFDILDQVSGKYTFPIILDMLVAVAFVAALIVITIGLFAGKHEMVRKAFVCLAVSYIIEFADLLLLLGMEGSLKYAFEGENAKVMFAMIFRYTLTAIACFISADLVKTRQFKQSIKSKWFVPGILFGVHIIIQLIFLGDLFASNGISLSESTSGSDVLLIISSLGMFITAGLAFYFDENPSMFNSMSAGTSSYNNNPYMNQAPKQPMYGQPQQPMYGQAPQQPMYGQAPQQPMYGQAPQQPMYGQAPQQPMYGQAPQQPMYGQAPQQPMYGQAPQQPMYGQAPQQPMYGQQNNYNNPQ